MKVSEEIWQLENLENQRPGQIETINEFLDWIRRDCPTRKFSLYMCARYGKSDAERNMAVLALAAGKAGAALVVHPWPALARQFLEATRITQWRQRWLPSGPRLNSISTLDKFAHGTLCNGEWLGSIHVHALLEPYQQLCLVEWVEHCKYVYGAPPVVCFDEAQHFSQRNVWGRVATRVHEAGALVIVSTATPFRNDGDDLFGFRTRPIGSPEPRTIKYPSAHPDPTKLYLHTSEREEQVREIEADVEIPFSQGWEEGCIAKASLDLIDWNMAGIKAYAGEKRMLSEIPEEDARRVLPTLYRDPVAVAEAVRRALKHIRLYRQHGIPDATMIWYGMDDTAQGGDASPSENQKLIKNALCSADSSLSVAIATLATDAEGSERAVEVIDKFVDPKKKHFDALVLKQMGAAGLDSDRISVVILWNTIRSLGPLIQMAMRGANTPKTHFVIIGLADCMTKDRLQAFIDGEGGQYVESVETNHTVEEITRLPEPERGYIPVSIADVGMGDTDGRFEAFEGVQLALYFASIVPPIYPLYTIPQMAALARQLGVQIPTGQGSDALFVDTAKAIGALRENLNAATKNIGKLMFFRQYGRKSSGSKEDLAEHGRLYKEVASLIKSRSGVLGSWDEKSKQCSQDPADYRLWTAAAESLRLELHAGVSV